MSTRLDDALDALDRVAELTFPGTERFDVLRQMFGGARFSLAGDRRSFMSVQEMSDHLGYSDTTSRKVIFALVNKGLADVVYAVQSDGVRRILVTGEASR